MTRKHRRVVVYIATSADGFIARADGDVKWLEREGSAAGYGLKSFLRSIDTIVWGRTTYEFGMAHGGLSMFGPATKHLVFTSRRDLPPQERVEFVNEPVAAFVQRLRSQPGKTIWLMGGARIIGSFFDAEAVDELMIHVIPTMIGEGIPLAAPARRTIPLVLKSAKTYPDGVVRLTYVPQWSRGDTPAKR